MRIVAGKWRGRALETPPERITRPTTDRNREALASMVESQFDLDLTEVSLLDAFAGSGAISFELLSRGAKFACLVDSDRQAQAAIKKNAKSLAVGKEFLLLQKDIEAALHDLSRRGLSFNLLMLDPPYALDAQRVTDLVYSAEALRILQKECLIVYEHDAKAVNLSLDENSSYSFIRTKSKGATAISLWRYTNE